MMQRGLRESKFPFPVVCMVFNSCIRSPRDSNQKAFKFNDLKALNYNAESLLQLSNLFITDLLKINDFLGCLV
jgi:hypothetical protein